MTPETKLSTPSWNDKNRIRWQTSTHISAHTRQRYTDRHIGDDHHPLSSGFHKKCKTLFNRTVRNCILHPWLLYLSAHLKPILFSEVSIMSNKYTWIWNCHRMCILTSKIARIYANVFIYTENILTKFYYHHYHHCIYCTIVLFMFACLQLFWYFHFCFCPLFFLLSLFSLSPKDYVMLCYVCHFFIVTRHWLIVK